MADNDADRTRPEPPSPEWADDTITIASPEGISVELSLAGLGSRFVAALVDTVLQLALWSAVTLLAVLVSSWAFAVAATIGSFAVVFGYFAAFETLDRGRTPGKRLSGLRVLRTDGGVVSAGPAIVRNLLRVVDFLPFGYGVGIVAILATPRHQRLGDLAAGTVVVRERRLRRPTPGTASPTRSDPGDDPATRGWDLTALTDADVAAAAAFVERRASLHPDSRFDVAERIDRALRPRTTGVPNGVPPEVFLEAVARSRGR